jgi:predicted DNA-binding transcriptional regulator AlpA
LQHGKTRQEIFMQTAAAPAALRPREAAAYLGIGLSTFWRRVKNEPDFPKLRKLSPKTSVALRGELDAYLAQLPAGSGEAQ